MLAQVEWGGLPETTRLAVVWRNDDPAQAEALACLRSPELAEIWTKPAARSEVWRERAFAIVLDGAWVTGVFDRVVVEFAPNGRAGRATVYDFKTDRRSGPGGSRAAGRHEAQIALYRRVVAVLAGLPVSSVGANLVFTETAEKLAVPPGD